MLHDFALFILIYLKGQEIFLLFHLFGTNEASLKKNTSRVP